MKKSWKIWGAALGIVVVTGAIWFGSLPKEPSYNGKTVSQWFYSIRSTRPDDSGVLAIKAMGTKAVPFLRKQLHVPRSYPRAKMFYWANRIPGMRILSDDDRFALATYCLQTLGPDAEAALPDLIGLANGTNRQEIVESIRTLGKIPSRPDLTIPLLVKKTSDSDYWQRWAAVTALGSSGSAARTAVPGLILQWKNATNSGTRYWTGDALRQIDPDTTLSLLMSNWPMETNSQMRSATFNVLMRMGPAAKPAYALIASNWPRETNVAVRGQMAGALARLDPDAALPLLISGWQTETNVDVRGAIVDSLASMGPVAKPAVSELSSHWETETNTWLRGRIPVALTRIDPAGAVPVLMSQWETENNPKSHAIIASVLAKMGSIAKPAVPMLVAEWRSGPDSNLRLAIEDALKKIDPEAAAKAGIK